MESHSRSPACSRYTLIGMATTSGLGLRWSQKLDTLMLTPFCMERGASETLPRIHSPPVRRRCETETMFPTENRRNAAPDALAAGVRYADPSKVTFASTKPRGGLPPAERVSEQVVGTGAADEEGAEGACDVASAAQVAIRLFTAAGRSSVGRSITRRA